MIKIFNDDYFLYKAFILMLLNDKKSILTYDKRNKHIVFPKHRLDVNVSKIITFKITNSDKNAIITFKSIEDKLISVYVKNDKLDVEIFNNKRFKYHKKYNDIFKRCIQEYNYRECYENKRLTPEDFKYKEMI